MNLHSQQWHVRWFFWSCRVLDRFCLTKRSRDYRDSRTERYIDGTNLCHFFRTLLWGNLIFLLTLMVYALSIYVAFVLPLTIFSAAGVGTVMLWTAVVLTGGVLFAALFILFVRSLSHWMIAYVENHPKKTADPQHPGFWRVVHAYCRALKERICPLIKFDNSADRSS